MENPYPDQFYVFDPNGRRIRLIFTPEDSGQDARRTADEIIGESRTAFESARLVEA